VIIGIIGSESTHAKAFADICEQLNIEAVIDDNLKPQADLDGVMIVTRDGNIHKNLALPFIEKGYPVWIDKPITETIADIEELRDAVKQNNALLLGGSTLKYNNEILSLKNRVKSGNLGEITGGFMNFRGDFDCEYGGIFFYGSHLCEMCLTVFGYDVKSVLATSISPENTIVIVKYDTKQIALHFNNNAYKYFAVAYGTEDCACVELDISNIYRAGFDEFLSTLKTKQNPLSFDKLAKPIYMLNAIKKSLTEQREIEIGGI
jgi:predicted dehydrogenase